MNGRLGFGARLRAHRERQGISLRTISESTKIKFSLLDALERGDVSQWPHGLFRRAYQRDYAAAINLPAEPLVAEFLQLFPEDGTDPAFEAVAATPLRLTLDAPPFAMIAARRGRIAAIEAGAVVAVGGALSWVTALTWLEAIGVAGLVYYPLAMLSIERAGLIHRLATLVLPHAFQPSTAESASSLEPARLYMVGRDRQAEQYESAVTEDDLPHTQTASR